MKNKKMLLIQLTRLGDLIQTFQAARQLKSENNDVDLYLVARKNFAKPLEFLLNTVFTKIYYVDRDSFLKERKTDVAAFNIKSFFDEINKEQFSASINFSFCKTSSYLNSLIKSPVKLGSRYNLQGEVSISDTWSQLIYASVLNGTLTPFNLVDLYRRILGAKELDTIATYNNVSEKKSIVIHPFASDIKKRWGATKWAELTYQLLKNNNDLTITVVGSANEKQEVKQILGAPILQNFSDRIRNWVGTKTIQDTYNALLDSRLFIGHDSMVSHLASVAGTKSLILSLGSVRPNETTAYGLNNFVLSPTSACFPCVLSANCEHLKCHNDISHQVVNQLSSQLINSDEFSLEELESNVAGFHLNNVNIHKTHLDDNLGQRLFSLNRRADSVEQTFIKFYEILWNLSLHNKDTPNTFPELGKPVLAELSRYQEGINNLYEVANFSMQYCNDIIDQAESKNPSIIKIKETSQRLLEIDNLALISRKPFPLLGPIIDFYYVSKANIDAENIVDVAEHSLISYHQAANGYAVLYELVLQCINKYAPQSKQSEQGM
jgi:ADP-heptose:LPS heptosyltransferase